MRRAFTLIEMLIVVVVIGLLVGIALPRYNESKRRTFLASMRADLHNLMSAQATYSTMAGLYSSDTAALSIRVSRGNILTIGEATGNGWTARITHPGVDGAECAIYVGTVGASTAPATTESQIACTP